MLAGALPEGTGVNLTVDATDDIGKLDDVLGRRALTPYRKRDIFSGS
jgi:hypothetical protein